VTSDPSGRGCALAIFRRTRRRRRIDAELAPTGTEAVIDKLTLSAFAGTPLEFALRACEVNAVAVAVVNVATEIGIEPAVRHAGDLGSYRW
jgi:nicotinamidase-related amidase